MILFSRGKGLAERGDRDLQLIRRRFARSYILEQQRRLYEISAPGLGFRSSTYKLVRKPYDERQKHDAASDAPQYAAFSYDRKNEDADRYDYYQE